MSKLKDSSCGAPEMIEQSQSIAPIVRFVHIIPPKVFITDPANFGALVQKLTGKHSALLSRQSLQKSKKKKKKQPIMSHRRSQSSHNEKLSYIGQDEFVTTFSQAESESVQDTLTWCDNFSGLFGVFDEQDIFAAQMHSDSMQPKFLTVDFLEEFKEPVPCD